MLTLREFPPNPHVVILHTDVVLTDEVVETYLAGSSSSGVEWIRRALLVDGLRVLSLNSYKIRLQKQKTSCWREVLPAIEKILIASLHAERVDDLLETEVRQRAFPWHGDELARQVFEGRLQAAAHPLAAALFALDGVSEVILDGHCIEVTRGLAFSWRALGPSIETAIQSIAGT